MFQPPVQGDMTEAMKTMDSGMAAAEQELRASSLALSPAAPPAPTPHQHPGTMPTDGVNAAANAAHTQQSHNAAGQMEDPALQLQKLNLSPDDVQQQRPVSDAKQSTAQPSAIAPAVQTSSERGDQDATHAVQRSSTQASASTSAPAEGPGVAGTTPSSPALLPHPVSACAAESGPSTSDRLQRPHNQLVCTASVGDPSDATKLSKQGPDSFVQILADSSSAAPQSPEQTAASFEASPTCAMATDSQPPDNAARAPSASNHASGAATAVGQVQDAAVEPWAAEEGDFAVMLKQFLVRPPASRSFTAHSYKTTAAATADPSCKACIWLYMLHN